MASNKKTKYLIIGNSAGGIGAAEAIREVDKKGTITIVSDEPYPAYSRPLISEYLAYPCPIEKMAYRHADFYDKNKIKTLFGEKVVRVNPEAHTVRLESGATLGWQKLLLATGGAPIFPDMKGNRLKGVFTFNRLDDSKAIDKFLNENRGVVRAVVIGGGLIGVSVTEALVKRNVDVTIVEMKDWVLNTILDAEAADFEAQALARANVKIITGHTAEKINSHLPGEVSGVTIDDGRVLPCQMAIIAIGVRPRLDALAGSGININRGIVIDRRMKTSAPDIYACGDVAEAHDFVYGENRLTPIWPNACEGGRVAGLNMAGKKAEYAGGTAMNSLKYFGVYIASAGMVAAPDDTFETLINRYNGVYKKVILKKGKLTGMVFAGDIEKSGIVYNLMKDGINVGKYKDALLAGDFGLASLPESVWKDRLERKPPAGAEVVTTIEEPEELVIGD
ncbi:MAG: NAD(P)/FAD-dependent oxidoreductase [Dehalococcoidales bacterium]|nr:NAD(P)/FAD-dependent oxidoreductase [Dehalococcoidales bacterium]